MIGVFYCILHSQATHIYAVAYRYTLDTYRKYIQTYEYNNILWCYAIVVWLFVHIHVLYILICVHVYVHTFGSAVGFACSGAPRRWKKIAREIEAVKTEFFSFQYGIYCLSMFVFFFSNAAVAAKVAMWHDWVSKNQYKLNKFSIFLNVYI